jgi:hypothetical protein
MVFAGEVADKLLALFLCREIKFVTSWVRATDGLVRVMEFRRVTS